ncbi:MAG: thioredoxin family protein [Spirochaetales bacterium]|jgi:thiol-disulfide isomerase/thioredoxin|nr:thioredoxin family protein [Spirochaetales bacterium]
MKRIIPIIVALLLTAMAVTGQGSKPDDMVSVSTDMGGTVDYSDFEDAIARAAAGPTVLFFYASWCPSCRADMRQIKARIDELDEITVIVVDYDRTQDLKKKYGVTYQHTFVQIDEKGDLVSIWNGGGVDGLLEKTAIGEMN